MLTPDVTDRARRRVVAALAALPFAARAAEGAEFTGRWVHAFAAYGAPKYGPGFTHFEYVNPEAPKGGTLRLKNPDQRTSFDKFNPWTLRGNAPAGIFIWMCEGLGHLAQDEPMTVYGLLAEALLVAPDFASADFRLRPEARFSNGDPVTPADVVHSFDSLAGPGTNPQWQTAVAGIARVLALDARTVRFEFRQKSRDQVFVAATMPVFSRRWGGGKPFEQVRQEPPILSGAYVIDRIEMPRRIEFRRNPDYWARALPVRRGHFNFDRVVYRMYADNLIALEAFKAGEFDLVKEYRARTWVRQHAGPKWDDGRIVKAPMRTAIGQYMQSFHTNMRRPLFQDIRVREALCLSYDFESANKTRQFQRVESCFNNTEFAAEGTPSAGELALLEPFRAELPATVFGPAWRAPRNDGAPDALRRNLLRARSLLEQAGWRLDAAGVLRNAQGQAFEFEFLEASPSNRVDWQRNLKKLGITMNIRLVDFALYLRRTEAYDFDVTLVAEPTFTLPSAADVAAAFGSRSFAEPGNQNTRGVKSRVADALIDAIGRAQTMQQLRDAARAFDRVATWSYWQLPDLYSSIETVSHWNRFGKPAVQARYFSADTQFTVFTEHGPWPLWTWWDRSLERT